jgi:hypothetical protein
MSVKKQTVCRDRILDKRFRNIYAEVCIKGIVKAELPLFLTNYALRLCGCGCIGQGFLDLGTSWR